MNTETNTPLDTIRDGSLKATIWKNPGKADKPPFYTVNLTRSYKDDQGNWRESNSFNGSELLRVSRLAGIAYGETLIYKAKDRDRTGGAS